MAVLVIAVPILFVAIQNSCVALLVALCIPFVGVRIPRMVVWVIVFPFIVVWIPCLVMMVFVVRIPCMAVLVVVVHIPFATIRIPCMTVWVIVICIPFVV